MNKDISVIIDQVKFNYRVGLLVECDNEVMVEVNPSCDFVVLPGGRIKTMEEAKNALIREMKEEIAMIFLKKN